MAGSQSTRGSGALAHERLRRAIVRLELPAGQRGLRAAARRALRPLQGGGAGGARAAARRGARAGRAAARPRRRAADAARRRRGLRAAPAARAAGRSAAPPGALEPAALERLRATVATPVDVEDAASIDRFLDGNRAVHVTVADAAGNRRLAALVERLLDDSERAIGVALRAGAAGARAARARRARGAARARSPPGDAAGRRADHARGDRALPRRAARDAGRLARGAGRRALTTVFDRGARPLPLKLVPFVQAGRRPRA